MINVNMVISCLVLTHRVELLNSVGFAERKFVKEVDELE